MSAVRSSGKLDELIRRGLRDVEGYAAPASLEELRARFGASLVKLDQNENPYGCSPRVQEALAKYDGYHAYPDVLSREVTSLIAEYVGVPAARIVVGNGSDEIIELALRLLIEPGDRVINCPPTFGYYRFAAEVAGAQVFDVHRRQDFSLDADTIVKSWDPRTKIMFVAAPNNPTGSLIEEADLLRVLETGMLVVVDEAYGEFSSRSLIPLTAHHDNLLIIRTFSKWAGLAGLRAGYGIFPLALTPYITKIKPPFNVNVAAQVAMKASLLDHQYLLDVIERIVNERERLFRELAKLDFLLPFPSQANFIFCRVLRGDVYAIKARLESEGILIRVYSDPLLSNAIRISVGTPEQDDILLERLGHIGETL